MSTLTHLSRQTFFNCLPKTLSALLLALVVLPLSANAKNEFMFYTLEELLQMEITSVSKTSQQISETPAAIYVITKEDIRRSGHNSVPELLRLAPGIHVAAINASTWSISARGFNGRWSNKLLVLIDGISVYTPLFSGVYWDIQDLLLENIERIEVIRGPGASVWGTNAVNGVINIITKSTKDTMDTFVNATAGNYYSELSFSKGGQLSDTASFRLSAKQKDTEAFPAKSILYTDNHDDWSQKRIGAYLDWQPSENSELKLKSNYYKGSARQYAGLLAGPDASFDYYQDDVDVKGGYLSVNYRKTLSENHNWSVNSYYYQNFREEYGTIRNNHTFDIEFIDQIRMNKHQISWGLQGRVVNDDLSNIFSISFDPESRKLNSSSVFFQDQLQLNEQYSLMLGIRASDNDFSGTDFQPTVRFAYKHSEHHYFWTSLSRAVRSPSRAEANMRLNVASFSNPFLDPDFNGPLAPGAPVVVSIIGNPELGSEHLKSAEIGYKGLLNSNTVVNTTIFYHSYSNLIAPTDGTPFTEFSPSPAHLVIPQTNLNAQQADSYGIEIDGNWQASDDLRINFSWSYLTVDSKALLALEDSSDAIYNRERSYPRSQSSVKAFWNLNEQTSFDLGVYYSGKISLKSPNGIDNIDSIIRTDATISWRTRQNLELTAVAQNIFDSSHLEYTTTELISSEIPRSFYVKAVLRF